MPLMNIVNSKALEPPRIKSGFSFYDKITAGGMICPGTYLLTGDSNAGKTTLVAQVLDGITGQGDIALFVSVEMIEAHLKMLLKRLNLKNGFLCSFDEDPVKVILDWKSLCDEQNALKKAGKPYKRVVLAVDSLQSLARHTTALDMLQQFAKRGEEFESTQLFIGQATKNGTYRGSAALQHEVTAHIHLSVVNNDKIQVREISTEKNRAGPCSTIYTELGNYGHTELEVDPRDLG